MSDDDATIHTIEDGPLRGSIYRVTNGEHAVPLTRRDLARLIAARNRRLAREIRRAARIMVAGDSAWVLVWIHRARAPRAASWSVSPSGWHRADAI